MGGTTPAGLQNESPTWPRFGVLVLTDFHRGYGPARSPPASGSPHQPRPVREWLGLAPAASLSTPPPRVPSPRVLRWLRSVSLHALYSPSRLQRGLPVGTWGRGRGAPAPDSPAVCPRLKAGLGGGRVKLALRPISE